ncbi:MAG: NAD(P)H-hydrate dehydratase [Bacteroidales bacterium]|nr:NAD(P)H-hydrate dehydratase [Bacteroidales bacterium]
MKILPVEDIRQADLYTIGHEPISDIDLMERAAAACFGWIVNNVDPEKKIKVFCGTGNNGGDGLVIGRLLIQKGFTVEYFLTGPVETCSPNCRINFERIISVSKGTSHAKSSISHLPSPILQPNQPLPVIEKTDIVVDAIFGSGLTRPVAGFQATLIHHINQSGAVVVAIDVPSGFSCDSTNFLVREPVVVKADYTLTFSPPKLGLFFPENERFTGKWILLDIGIMKEYIPTREVKNFMLEKSDCQKLLKKRNKFAHKGNFGHALLLCGSAGKMGAAILATRACLRSGPGLVTVRTPKAGMPVMQSAVPEAMVTPDDEPDIITSIPDLSPYSSIGIGPGIGLGPQTGKALKLLIQQSVKPLIIDADAINLLSENKTWLGFIPHGSIFTPHPKEFERIAGKSQTDFERNEIQREFSFRYQCYVVLKGAYTAITTPDGQCFFNTTGNPGMATGGSGDVLTGIITGLMAQGYQPLESCLLGVYVHGLAGDFALASEGYEALIASDIINNLGKSFHSLYGKF